MYLFSFTLKNQLDPSCNQLLSLQLCVGSSVFCLSRQLDLKTAHLSVPVDSWRLSLSLCPQSGSLCGSVCCSVGSAGPVTLQAPLREPLWLQRSSVASDSCRWTTPGRSRCTPRCSSPTGRWTRHEVRVTVETTPVPVFCHLQVSEELSVAAGLCRTDLRTDPS